MSPMENLVSNYFGNFSPRPTTYISELESRLASGLR